MSNAGVRVHIPDHFTVERVDRGLRRVVRPCFVEQLNAVVSVVLPAHGVRRRDDRPQCNPILGTEVIRTPSSPGQEAKMRRHSAAQRAKHSKNKNGFYTKLRNMI